MEESKLYIIGEEGHELFIPDIKDRWILSQPIKNGEPIFDVVIPLADFSRHDDMELKFTLRSIEKYLTGYRDIYIIGKKRTWLKDVKYINAPDISGSKARTIYSKVMAAASNEDVTESFIAWSDDCFLLKPLDTKDFKHWAYSDLKTLSAKSKGVYQYTVSQTMNYCKKKGWPITNFNIHAPIVYEKEKFLSLADEDWTKEMILKSIYCNKYQLDAIEMKDLVFRMPMRRGEIRTAVAGRTFFAISETGTNEAVKDVLGELFPLPSKYEKYDTNKGTVISESFKELKHNP